ncbi:general transcription factor II-I repeat domain-containing protein 2-like [Pseudomyrmex gracilis]|uniref:general transcription factor II-I repeat domain-containing protein 2-like n=1 Tax=Pseudomyrmex gracilis TaxID=219809 RepID=UPI0009955B6E|nr:general transcription factor II-I repeat domain-containing protein 2-like [Pseudomyrmex gracilis]
MELLKELKLRVIDYEAEESDLASAKYASYKISHAIARESRPFTCESSIKKCLEIAAESVCPNDIGKVKAIRVSARTVARRVENFSADLVRQLELKAKTFIAYSLALDESTDITDISQLAIFFRGVNNNLVITEELLDIISLKDTTTGEDVIKSVEKAMTNISLSWENLVSVATVGAAAMVGQHAGFIGRLESKLRSQSRQEIYSIHCIIHQKALCAKSLKYEEVSSELTNNYN